MINATKDSYLDPSTDNYLINYSTVKTNEGVHCSVIEHGMMSLSFQTVVQKNEAKLSSFV